MKCFQAHFLVFLDAPVAQAESNQWEHVQQVHMICLGSKISLNLCWQNFSFSYKIVFLFHFHFFVIAATSLGSTAPVYSFTSTVESISKSGIKIGEAIQDSEVWEEDEEEDDYDDEDDEGSFTTRKNQPTAALIYGISLLTKELAGSYGKD